MLCDKITVIVNDQNKQHGKKISISSLKVGEGKSREDIKDAKLATHGIAVSYTHLTLPTIYSV